MPQNNKLSATDLMNLASDALEPLGMGASNPANKMFAELMNMAGAFITHPREALRSMNPVPNTIRAGESMLQAAEKPSPRTIFNALGDVMSAGELASVKTQRLTPYWDGPPVPMVQDPLTGEWVGPPHAGYFASDRTLNQANIDANMRQYEQFLGSAGVDENLFFEGVGDQFGTGAKSPTGAAHRSLINPIRPTSYLDPVQQSMLEFNLRSLANRVPITMPATTSVDANLMARLGVGGAGGAAMPTTPRSAIIINPKYADKAFDIFAHEAQHVNDFGMNTQLVTRGTLDAPVQRGSLADILDNAVLETRAEAHKARLAKWLQSNGIYQYPYEHITW